MRKSKGRKSGKAESDKRDDAQNGDPERDSNEGGEDEDEDDVKPKKSSRASKRQSRSSRKEEDYDSEEQGEDEDEDEDKDEEDEKPAKKSKKRKSSPAKKGKGKSKKSRKGSESDNKSDDEGKKSKKGRKSAAKDDDSDEEEVSKEEYEVARIMNVHFKKNGEREFLVRWKGYSSRDDTWEPEAHLNCKDLINTYLKKCEEARNTTQRETRVNRKKTDRFILNSQETGRKLSGRHKGKPRKTYFEDE